MHPRKSPLRRRGGAAARSLQIARNAANLLQVVRARRPDKSGAFPETLPMTSSRILACVAVLGSGLALAACETTGPGAPTMAAAPAPQPPMTRQQAAMECWMGTEKADAHVNLDKRADIVDRCIAEKLKNAPPAHR
jgi:hypothetical protein